MFGDRKGIDASKRWGSSFLEVDMVITRSVRREPIGFSFTEDVRVIVVFRRYSFIENRIRRYVREVSGVGMRSVGNVGNVRCSEHEGL